MAREFAKAFYKSKEWIKCRYSYIKEVHGLCEQCQAPGWIVHHKIHLSMKNINNPDVTLNHNNLEYLCLECHNKHHQFNREKKKSTKEGYKFNSNGELVYSPPIKT